MEDPFKLKVLLKLKKFEEYQEKVNLGKILKKIQEEKSKMSFLSERLDRMHSCQSVDLDEGVESGILRSYPGMFQGMSEKMRNCKENLKNLENDYEKLRSKLNVVLGEVKVLQRMEDNHKENCRKKIKKKKEEEIEDVVNMRRSND